MPQDIIDVLWLPHLISNSFEAIHADDIRQYSLSLDIINGSTTTLKAVIQNQFTNMCPQMSFWNFPYDGFSCDFYLRHRSLMASDALLNGQIVVRNDLQRPSDFNIKYEKVPMAFDEFQSTNYSIVGYKVVFARKIGIYINTFYLPMISFAGASFASFMIPPLDGNDRTCMLITLFLVNVQMSLYISDTSPEADDITGLEIFTTVMIIFIFSAIIEYIIILGPLTRHRHDKDSLEYEMALKFANQMDKSALIVFPCAMLLFLITYILYYEVYSRQVDIRDGRIQMLLS